MIIPFFIYIFALKKVCKCMKICAFSDMHGNLDFNVNPCDIVLIGGDIFPLKIQSYSSPSEEWFKTNFIPWCNSLPCQKVVFVAGNHDHWLERHGDRARLYLKDEDKIIYLDCEITEYEGKVIYGTPLCKPFGRWAFMPSLEEQEEKYIRHLNAIEHIDLILAHDAPYGVSDIILQEDCPWADGTHIGNKALTKFIETAQPDIMLHGHLHSSNRNAEFLGKTRIHNISLLNENYELVYKPIYINLE